MSDDETYRLVLRDSTVLVVRWMSESPSVVMFPLVRVLRVQAIRLYQSIETRYRCVPSVGAWLGERVNSGAAVAVGGCGAAASEGVAAAGSFGVFANLPFLRSLPGATTCGDGAGTGLAGARAVAGSGIWDSKAAAAACASRKRSTFFLFNTCAFPRCIQEAFIRKQSNG